jgi:hypothetical protein
MGAAQKSAVEPETETYPHGHYDGGGLFRSVLSAHLHGGECALGEIR